MKINTVFSLLICLLTLISQGQIANEFSDKNSYFEYINKKYSLNSSSIYYTSDDTKSTVFLFPSFTYFIKNEKIITIDEISDALNTKCPPNKLFKQLSNKFIDSLLNKKEDKVKIVFKNLKSGKKLEQNDEIVAIFLFSVNLKKLGTRYIRHKNTLEKLGIKTFVLSIDMPLINDVTDYSKINQIRFKKN
jgi:hypothetical protein